jgi:ribonuclease P protein component
LRRQADFDRVFKTGRHDGGRLIAVRSARNDQTWSRFGYSISKRVGSAVTRNRVRRRLREILRQQPLQEGFDIVIVARPAAAESDFASLKAEAERLLGRARLIVERESPPGRFSP